MAIKHTIRTKTGTETLTMTAGEAIHQNCIDCCGFQPYEVRRCTAYLCPLWPFRNGPGRADRSRESVGERATER